MIIRSPPKSNHLVLRPRPTPPQISLKSLHNFLSNLADRQTNKQTDPKT